MSLPQGGRAPAGWEGKTLGELATAALRGSDPVSLADEVATYLVGSSEDIKLVSSRLDGFRRELRKQGAPPSVVAITRRPDVIERAKAERSRARRQPGNRAYDGIRVPEMYACARVKERLEAADIKQIPTRQNVIDAMIALCARPAEVRTLQITPEGVVGFAKNTSQKGSGPRPFASFISESRAKELLQWIQAAINDKKLPDPGVVGSKPYRAILPQGLLPKDLRVLGAEYASSGADTDTHRRYLRKLALRHANPEREDAVDHYTIIRREPHSEPAPPPKPVEKAPPAPEIQLPDPTDFDGWLALMALMIPSPNKPLQERKVGEHTDSVKQPETRFAALVRRYTVVGWSEDRVLQLYFEKLSAMFRQRIPELLWQVYSELEDKLDFLECEAEDSLIAALRA